MSKPWRELVVVYATYYTAGEYPSSPGTDPAEANRPSLYDSDVWWYPGAEARAAMGSTAELEPELDDDGRLVTDAIRFEFSAPHAGAWEHPDSGGLIAYEVGNTGWRETFSPYVDTLKACCDKVRGSEAHRWVTVLIVFECEAGKDPDTWLGPGDYWSQWRPIGLLDLARAEVEQVTP